MGSSIAFAAASVAFAIQSVATQPAPPDPARIFKISEAKNRCIASRSLKYGSREFVVALEARPPNPSYQIRLYVPVELRRWDDGEYSLAKVKLESDHVMARSSNPPGSTIYVMSITRPELIAAGLNPTLEMREVVSPGDITLSGLGSALSLVDACSTELVERWGYSKEFQSQLAVPPKPRKHWAYYVTPQDFPRTAIWNTKGGETHVLVDVGLDGRASNCRIIHPSGSDDIDRKTCEVMTDRARYEPARNVKGERIAAPFYSVFRWEIPAP